MIVEERPISRPEPMAGERFDQFGELVARRIEIVVHDRVFDVDFDQREVIGDLLLLGHA